MMSAWAVIYRNGVSTTTFLEPIMFYESDIEYTAEGTRKFNNRQ